MNNYALNKYIDNLFKIIYSNNQDFIFTLNLTLCNQKILISLCAYGKSKIIKRIKRNNKK